MWTKFSDNNCWHTDNTLKEKGYVDTINLSNSLVWPYYVIYSYLFANRYISFIHFSISELSQLQMLVKQIWPQPGSNPQPYDYESTMLTFHPCKKIPPSHRLFLGFNVRRRSRSNQHLSPSYVQRFNFRRKNLRRIKPGMLGRECEHYLYAMSSPPCYSLLNGDYLSVQGYVGQYFQFAVDSRK